MQSAHEGCDVSYLSCFLCEIVAIFWCRIQCKEGDGHIMNIYDIKLRKVVMLLTGHFWTTSSLLGKTCRLFIHWIAQNVVVSCSDFWEWPWSCTFDHLTLMPYNVHCKDEVKVKLYIPKRDHLVSWLRVISVWPNQGKLVFIVFSCSCLLNCIGLCIFLCRLVLFVSTLAKWLAEKTYFRDIFCV